MTLRTRRNHTRRFAKRCSPPDEVATHPTPDSPPRSSGGAITRWHSVRLEPHGCSWTGQERSRSLTPCGSRDAIVRASLSVNATAYGSQRFCVQIRKIEL
jgi:hypothetical protein